MLPYNGVFGLVGEERVSKVKIEASYSAKYAPIVLWWDDVTGIFEILQEKASSVEMETTQYKFTTLDVAKEHLGDAPEYGMKFSSSSPYVKLESGSLYVGAGPASAQIFMEIDAILKARERRPRWIYSGWLFMPVVVLGLVGFVLKEDATKSVVIAIQVIFALLYSRGIFMTMKRGLVVYPQRKSEARGFFGRNKDQLLMLVITAVVSGLLGFAGSQLKERFFPPTYQK